MKAFMLLIALSGCALHMVDAIKCDCKVTDGIKKYWGPNVPKDIIKKNEAIGEEVVWATTANYFPAGTKEIRSHFKDGKVYITIVPNKGEAKTNTYVTREADGVTFSPGSDVKMWHIYNKGGCRAVYKCTDSESAASGSPEAYIKVLASGYDKACAAEAEKVLAGLGCSLTTKYPTC